MVKRVYIARSRVEGRGLLHTVLMQWAEDQDHQDSKVIFERVADQLVQDSVDRRRVERQLRLIAHGLGYQLRFSRVPKTTGGTILKKQKVIERYLRSGY